MYYKKALQYRLLNNLHIDINCQEASYEKLRQYVTEDGDELQKIPNMYNDFKNG